MLSNVYTLLVNLWYSSGVGFMDVVLFLHFWHFIHVSVVAPPSNFFIMVGAVAAHLWPWDRNKESLYANPAQTELKSLFFHPQKLDLFVSYFNAIVNKKKKKVPCGGHRLAPSGHSRSYKLDGECLVKEKRTGSVQGCWQRGHMVNQPGCLLVVVTLKRSSRWWLLLLIDTPWIMYQKGSINLQGTYITTSQKNLTDATFLHSIRLLEGCFGSSAFGLI